jgi:hypothetical protein
MAPKTKYISSNVMNFVILFPVTNGSSWGYINDFRPISPKQLMLTLAFAVHHTIFQRADGLEERLAQSPKSIYGVFLSRLTRVYCIWG